MAIKDIDYDEFYRYCEHDLGIHPMWHPCFYGCDDELGMDGKFTIAMLKKLIELAGGSDD